MSYGHEWRYSVTYLGLMDINKMSFNIWLSLREYVKEIT